MDNWVKINRQILDHWLWDQKPFSKGIAWLDILLNVRWKKEPKAKFIKGKELVIERGQSIYSLRTWAQRWGWNIASVRRFLMLLQKDNMIVTENVTVTTRLTVCNYDKWQGQRNADETQTVSQMKRKQYTKEECKEGKKDKNIVLDKKVVIRERLDRDWKKFDFSPYQTLDLPTIRNKVVGWAINKRPQKHYTKSITSFLNNELTRLATTASRDDETVAAISKWAKGVDGG